MTQDAPRHPETLPKRATDHSKTSQRRPKMSPRRPKGRPIRPKGCQRHPKGRPRPPKGRPRRPKTRPTGPKRCPRRQHDQIWPPKASQNGVPGSPWTPKHKCWAGGIPEGITIKIRLYVPPAFRQSSATFFKRSNRPKKTPSQLLQKKLYTFRQPCAKPSANLPPPA